MFMVLFAKNYHHSEACAILDAHARTHIHKQTNTHTYKARKKAFIRNWLGLAESSQDGEGRWR